MTSLEALGRDVLNLGDDCTEEQVIAAVRRHQKDAEPKRYNGWANYETWNVALWIGNEQGSQRYWDDAAQDAYRDAAPSKGFTRAERATLTLSDQLKDSLEEGNPLADNPSCYSDLLGAALSEVNWYEIAEHYVNDVAEAIDKEEADEAAEEEEADDDQADEDE